MRLYPAMVAGSCSAGWLAALPAPRSPRRWGCRRRCR